MKSLTPPRVRTLLQSYAIVGILLALLWHLYGLHGNVQETERHGHSALLWLVNCWGRLGDEFSYGWLIPLVSIFIVWKKRDALATTPISTGWVGLCVIIFSLLLHWFGISTQQTRISLFSLIGLLWGVPCYLYGWRVGKILLFPCAYLLFCIPTSLLDVLTVPLRLMTSALSANVLNGLGISAMREGTLIFSTNPGGFRLGVDDPCSGLRSLMAIAALTSVYAYSLNIATWKKLALFFSAIPLAIVANTIRVIMVAIVAGSLGSERAMGLYHDYSGYAVFAVAVFLMMGVERLLERVPGKRLSEWIQTHTSARS